MSTLTGQSISGSYLGLIHLSTNTQIANNTNTQLQDGAGNNLGVFVNTNGTLTATNFSGSLTGTASNATFAVTARTASYAATANTASYANYAAIAGLVITASYALFAASSSYSATSQQATSASYAATAQQAVSSSFATTASWARNAATFPYTGSATISGSLTITGSVNSFSVNGVVIGTGNWQSTTASWTAASASSNLAIGSGSLAANYSSPRNTAIGVATLANAGTYTAGLDTDNDGLDNTAVGFRAGYSISRFGGGTYIGSFAGYGDGGNENTAVGFNAMGIRGASVSGSWYNTAVGVGALSSLSASLPFIDGTPNPLYGQRNVGLGHSALGGIVTGNDNIGIGYRTLYDLDQGSGNPVNGKSKNIAIGTYALLGLISGSNNITLGYNAASIVTSGSNNIMIGNDMPASFTSGSGNTIIGNNTAYNPFVSGSGGGTFINNNVIIADGRGTVRLRFDNNGGLTLNGPAVTTSVATASTHKIAVNISGSIYYLLATT